MLSVLAPALVGSMLLAVLSTVADYVWFRGIPQHQVSSGMIHGAVLFAALGAYHGWRKGKVALISNKVKLSHSGLNTALAINLTPPIRMRQTLRIGDDCATGVLECTPNSLATVIKCTTPIFVP